MSNGKVTTTNADIFGATEDELLRFVANAAGEPVDSFRIAFEYQLGPVKGFNADKILPTFYWTGRSGARGRTIMFVKRNPPGHREAFHYAHLGRHGAPIPRLYGAMRDEQGRDILFLEYLDALYDEDWFFSDPERCRRYFSTMARFHAIRPDPEYMAELERKDMGQVLREALDALDSAWQACDTGELGPELQALCQERAAALPALKDMAARCAARAKEMPSGLSCCGPLHQCGWRRDTGELVFADIDGVSIAPRFWNVGDEIAGGEAPGDFALSREELGACYLQELSRHGGETVSLDAFLSEVRDVGLLSNVHVLNFWLRGPVASGARRREMLHATLNTLLAEIGR
jgi:hypothetical protein